MSAVRGAGTSKVVGAGRVGPWSVAVALAAALVLAGCGGGSTSSPGSTSSTSSTPGLAPSTTSGATATASGTTPTSTSSASAAGRCTETQAWNTADVSTAPQMTESALYLVEVGQHDCYDRVVFDVNGPAEVGIDVKYVPLVLADASGQPLPVAGSAVLQVVVRAPALGSDTSGHAPGKVLAQTGDYLHTEAELANWNSLRAVRFAGSFEGQCTFAVGVRDRLPFRAFTLLNTANQMRQVVVDVAHN
ncbi:MAG: AMIN-like domain-containing (lipo)protein [Mycobacteriaceae bacterium]